MWNYHALSLPPSVPKRRPKIFHIFLTFDVSQSRSPDLCPALPILTPPHLPGAFLHLKVEPSLPFQLGLKMLKVGSPDSPLPKKHHFLEVLDLPEYKDHNHDHDVKD